MPFTSLLLTGLVPEGKFEENHVGVALVPSGQAEKETMLLFEADNSDNFHNVYLPEIQKLSSTPSCCDLICFAHKLHVCNNGNCKRKITIGLIELKGGKNDQTKTKNETTVKQAKKAVEQILNTRDGIVAGLSKAKIEIGNITWKAIIIIKSTKSTESPNKKSAKSNAMPNNMFTDLRNGLKQKGIEGHIIFQDQKTINLTKFMQTGKIEDVNPPISPTP